MVSPRRLQVTYSIELGTLTVDVVKQCLNQRLPFLLGDMLLA